MSAGHWTEQKERASERGMRFLIGVMRLTGPGLVKILVIPVALYYYLTTPAARRYSRLYRQHLSAAARDRALPLRLPAWFAFRHILAFAQAMVDRVHVWSSGSGSIPYVVDGLSLLESVLEPDRRGAVFLVSHHGNFDLSIVRSDVVPEKRFNIVMDTRGTRIFNHFRDQLFQSGQVRFLAPTDVDAMQTMALVQRVEQGEIIVIAADRTGRADGGNSVEAPFLGATARFPIGPWVLAHVLEVPVYSLFARMENGGCYMQFELFADKVELPRRTRREAMQSLASRYAARLEKECFDAPLDWFNFYDFWQRAENDAGGRV